MLSFLVFFVMINAVTFIGNEVREMNDKMNSCFTPHVLMHTLFGVGLGFLLAGLFAGLATPWLGVALMIVAVVLDMIRK